MGWWSIVPPVLAIGLSMATRQVHLGLFVGVWLGASLLAHGNPLEGLADAIERCVLVFADAGNTKVVLFTALVGALIALGRRSGGVDGFIRWATERRLVDSARRARMLSWTLGVVVFVESSITVLVNGAVCRPLFERYGVSRAKLAYLADSTSAPICLLIPLNAWGAYIAQLLAAEGVADPVGSLLAAVGYSFYPLFAVALSLYVAWTGLDLGPMRRAEQRAAEEQLAADGVDGGALGGARRHRDQRAAHPHVPPGDAERGHGVPALLFVLGAAIAFSTGTSWGTFALIVPVAVALGGGVSGAPLAVCVGAALSGGVFGDHCSPISDTTIIASTASGCDHVEHVATQLPYALAAGAAATVAYVVAGYL